MKVEFKKLVGYTASKKDARLVIKEIEKILDKYTYCADYNYDIEDDTT